MKARLTALCICIAGLFFQASAAESTEAERKRFQETKLKAEAGDAAAQQDLGLIYFNGRGVEKSSSEAANWWRKAAEQNNALAQRKLGAIYQHGEGVEQDDEAAVKWYRRAADQHDRLAQCALGFMYEVGRGVAKNEGDAASWYRKAAEQGEDQAQANLGLMYATGRGVAKDEVEGVKWYRKAAEQGHAGAQSNLGAMYAAGRGVAQDEDEAVKWYRKAADQGNAKGQFNLGLIYAKGRGVAQDEAEAIKWYRKAAEQGDAGAQVNLGFMYDNGNSVVKDEVEGYKWYLLAGAQGNEVAKKNIPLIERDLTAAQRAEGQRLAREWKPRKPEPASSAVQREGIAQSRPDSSGTGFFITEDGYFVTNQHVAGEGATVRLVTATGSIAAKVVKVDRANDLALLKAEGKFTALPVITSRGVRLGATTATVGFPNTGLQGFAPKLAKGEIASLAGAQDDARHFQISAPIQPGNSGGALVDERGNVIGVVVAKLSQRAALATSGALAENVNYAVKSSYLLSFLESVPEVAAKLKEAHTKERKFEDVVKSVEQATVLVLVY